MKIPLWQLGSRLPKSLKQGVRFVPWPLACRYYSWSVRQKDAAPSPSLEVSPVSRQHPAGTETALQGCSLCWSSLDHPKELQQ